MHKRILILSLLFNGFIVFCNAQNNTVNQSATVYFIRITGEVGWGAFSVFMDDSLACHLNNNRYSIHSVNPGLHKFQVRIDGNNPKKRIQTLDIPMQAGQTYYIAIDAKERAAGYYATVSLIEVTENTARKILPPLKEDTNCK